jgi:hypothetical protein
MLRSCFASLVFLIISSGGFAQDKPNCVNIPPVDCNALAQSISCDVPRDERECKKCLVALFGRCQVRGNDPACEAAKAAQNQLYSIKKGQCEGEKAVRKGQCEATNAAIKEASCKG